jgi:phosphoglycerate dehydrogenase-like enzyme
MCDAMGIDDKDRELLYTLSRPLPRRFAANPACHRAAAMKMIVYPAISERRLAELRLAAGPMAVVNCESVDQAAIEICDADAIFGSLTPELLQLAPKLRWAQSPTASMEKYLFPELVASRVVVTNMRGIFNDVIAEHVFGMILCFSRNLHLYIRQQMHGIWQAIGRDADETPGYGGPGEVTAFDRATLSLADCTLGIVGMGGIGREVARRGSDFGMRVMGLDPSVIDAPARLPIYPPELLNDILPQCDFVVIAAPHTPETVKLFDRERIRRMKRTAYLINVGRGVIVDLADLTAALEAGEIAGAGLDVFEIEPLPAEHPLWKMPNVIITPHAAAASPRVAERHLETLLDNVRRFVAGQPLRNVVDKSRWY